MIHVKHSAALQRQSGAVLLIAMTVLFLLALMGGSALRSASMERQLVTNAVQSRDVFQAAESSNEEALNDSQNLIDAYNAAGGAVVLTTSLRDDIGLESQVTLRYINEGNASGASLNAMQGASSFDALQYVAEGVAKVDSVASARSVHMGARRFVPAN